MWTLCLKLFHLKLDYLHTKNEEDTIARKMSTRKRQGIISWLLSSSNKKQNKCKAYIIFLNSSEQEKEKVQSAGKKAFLEKHAHSK